MAKEFRQPHAGAVGDEHVIALYRVQVIEPGTGDLEPFGVAPVQRLAMLRPRERLALAAEQSGSGLKVLDITQILEDCVISKE